MVVGWMKQSWYDGKASQKHKPKNTRDRSTVEALRLQAFLKNEDF